MGAGARLEARRSRLGKAIAVLLNIESDSVPERGFAQIRHRQMDLFVSRLLKKSSHFQL